MPKSCLLLLVAANILKSALSLTFNRVRGGGTTGRVSSACCSKKVEAAWIAAVDVDVGAACAAVDVDGSACAACAATCAAAIGAADIAAAVGVCAAAVDVCAACADDGGGAASAAACFCGSC